MPLVGINASLSCPNIGKLQYLVLLDDMDGRIPIKLLGDLCRSRQTSCRIYQQQRKHSGFLIYRRQPVKAVSSPTFDSMQSPYHEKLCLERGHLGCDSQHEGHSARDVFHLQRLCINHRGNAVSSQISVTRSRPIMSTRARIVLAPKSTQPFLSHAQKCLISRNLSPGCHPACRMYTNTSDGGMYRPTAFR